MSSWADGAGGGGGVETREGKHGAPPFAFDFYQLWFINHNIHRLFIVIWFGLIVHKRRSDGRWLSRAPPQYCLERFFFIFVSNQIVVVLLLLLCSMEDDDDDNANHNQRERERGNEIIVVVAASFVVLWFARCMYWFSSLSRCASLISSHTAIYIHLFSNIIISLCMYLSWV